ncbi:U3 small nucleolar RNA-associated protein 6-domain-containing protein [Epithele typhae]|uniref:U3 small nucleolar RNA-associated protein 6-domain-containing protein n=1 Tax=Epithele typhae TaxID=378194 RepID=UPI002007EE3D|nr:U3 small nucleolar RNA-associated protein 6-domain-containing protein [Epithele typhae]KAH9942332.1 U3 small nucleolar RNA-associated protein 6-domain-containing protein [Epithele typhae]
MERVQFQQEQMLAELKDLVQKGLFTQKEAKQIMQKRTAFETALVRRIPKKSDFLRYATYEMSLETLRRQRAKRLNLEKGSPTISDYALVRRQFQIFERTLKKFKGDVGLWIQYIQVAKKEGARSLVGRITARALQLHPGVPSLYVFAASHELEHLSPSAARALLQRGLRLNANSVEMWREYVRMELGFVESLRRRWGVLGIDVKGKGKEVGADHATGTDGGANDPWAGLGDEDAEAVGNTLPMDVDPEEADEDEAARREIMNGAIVRSVISSAVKAITKVEMFVALHELISTYPSPPPLKESLLDHLHDLLHKTLPSHPAAIKLSSTRRLTPDLSGEPLQLSANVRKAVDDGVPGLADVYSDFLLEWCEKDVDNSLKAYLITPAPPVLVAAHIRLLVTYHASLGSALLPPKVNTPDGILRASRRHTTKTPASATVWQARLDAERQFAEPEAVKRAWDDARRQVQGEGCQKIWLWGLESHSLSRLLSLSSAVPGTKEGNLLVDPEATAEVELLEQLLHESQLIREPVVAGAIHEELLIRYAAASNRALPHHPHAPPRPSSTSAMAPRSTRVPAMTPDRAISSPRTPSLRVGTRASNAERDAELEARLARVQKIGTAYRPTARVWAELFAQETSPAPASHARSGGGAPSAADTAGDDPRGSGADYFGGDRRVLEVIYERWRRCDGVAAMSAWAAWLLRSGDGKEAIAVVARARGVLGEQDGLEVERRWKRVLDGDTADDGAEEEDVEEV